MPLRCPPRALAAAAVLLLLAAAVPVPPAAAVACPTPSHVWFLGVVYDPDQREDFKKDVDNIEFYLAMLRTTYCIPDSQAKVFAFENNFQRNGKTYADGSEANVKATIASFGAQASQFGDSLLFFFLSSHGFVYVGSFNCPSRPLGSFAQLKAGAGQDGFLDDCELGQVLNANVAASTRIVALVDCSLCGGFSDSLTAVSGTVPDNALPQSSGIPRANRIVMTGCSMTTECFGGDCGGVSFCHLRRVIEQQGPEGCDGWTVPGFPTLQGADAPVRQGLLNPRDNRCTMSEWFFAAVWDAYGFLDVTGIQQQFRMKYGFASLGQDVLISDS
ncbi:MAG TPA: hypothetical protein VGR28_04750 [Candidatus Thermoplasmatota archaeon]|nr:hypothetical protein [Candidatus Thermoplasmatota archaeon]